MYLNLNKKVKLTKCTHLGLRLSPFVEFQAIHLSLSSEIVVSEPEK